MIKNIKGKIKYIISLIHLYDNWLEILLSRVINRKIYKVSLKNGLIVEGGSRSLILDITQEIFADKIYTSDEVYIKNGDNVLDIGSNIGVFALFAFSQSAKHIYCIEPDPDNINLIKKNISNNNIQNIETFKYAISGHNCQNTKLYKSDYDSHESLILVNNGKLSDSIDVRSITLEKLLNSIDLEKIDFLKMDCEGSEGDIIKYSNKIVWGKINKISIEYHDKLSTLNHDEICNKLQSFGFQTKIKKIDNFLGYVFAWK